MNDTCSHAATIEIQGDTWIDVNGYPHTIVYLRCANIGCERYGKTVCVRQTGQDVPFTPVAQTWPVGVKP